MLKTIGSLLSLAALLAALALSASYLGAAVPATGAGVPRATTGRPVWQSPPPTTFCPPATPEPLWVEPVDSPTCCLSQVISVTIGNGEYVSVTAESGTFEISGTFSVIDPATVSIGLLPDTTHHLQVTARVRVVHWGDCTYGGYTLSTDRDRLGQPLVIVQGDGCYKVHLPLVLSAAGRR